MSSPDMEHCLKLVKTNASDLYFADLLLPKILRDEIIVLHAFHVEIINAILASREPMAGEIRLQWWADVIAGNRSDDASGHPVARAFLQLINQHQISRTALGAKLQAHIFDLYSDPMGDRTMLEGHLGETRSILFQIAGNIAGAGNNHKLADACGHSGVATGIVSCLENMAMHRNLQRIYIPSDLLTAVGLSASEFLSELTPNHEQAVLGFVDLANEHYAKAISALETLTPELRTIFKPLAIVPYYLKRAKNYPNLVLTGQPRPSQFKRQWAIWQF